MKQGWGAESKDPEGAYPTHAVRTLSNTEAHSWRISHGLPPGPRTRTGSILLCPAATSTFSAAIQACFTLALPATYICASCNIRRASGRFHCGLWLQAPALLRGLGRQSHSHRSGKTMQRLAARKEAQPHSHDPSRVQRPCTDLGMEDDFSA